MELTLHFCIHILVGVIAPKIAQEIDGHHQGVPDSGRPAAGAGAGEEADAMVGSGGQAGPSVASKIFAVLDAFDGSASSLRLSVIAVRTGMPMPTALRVVRELV